MKHINVIITTPGNSMSSTYVISLVKTITELHKRKISWYFYTASSSHVGDAREITIAGNVEDPYGTTVPLNNLFSYDKIMCIDSDISWEPEDFLKLYYSKKDIVSGVYLMTTGTTTSASSIFADKHTEEYIKSLKDDIEICYSGLGFTCIKSGVFEKLSKPWFQSININIKKDDGTFEYTHITGEDTSWFLRVKELGFKVWLDPTVCVTHHKTVPLRIKRNINKGE
jgi:hypothetical protein